MRVLGVVPARGGSKGIPRKNIRSLLGKPVLQYTAEACLAATRLSRVILSTEDPEIAEVGRRCGMEVPFLRPDDLARDDTPTLPVVQHAVHWMEEQGFAFDAICLLQPTNPLRLASDIDACIATLEDSGCDAVVSTKLVPVEFNPHWVYFSNARGELYLSTGEQDPVSRRQDLPYAYHREGSVYVTRRDVVMTTNSLYGRSLRGYPIDADRSVNLDTLEDWSRAETLIAKRYNNDGI